MSIAPFPHHYATSLVEAELGAAGRPSIQIGAPPEFGGRGDVWSPEQLLLGSVIACLKTTFDAYAMHAKLPIHHWRAVATGILDKGAGGPAFTQIHLEVDLETEPGDEARARELLDTAERHCIIARSLAVPVELAANVAGSTARAAG